MVTTEYLADKTLLIHVEGKIDTVLAKEVSLLVFRSFRLGVTTFLLNLKRSAPVDEGELFNLALIGEGLHDQGGNWKILKSSSPIGNWLILHLTLEHLPPETWN